MSVRPGQQKDMAALAREFGLIASMHCAGAAAKTAASAAMTARTGGRSRFMMAWVRAMVPSSSAIIAVTTPSSPFSSFDEMIRYARANPGKLNWGSAGAGGMPHLYLEAVRQSLGVDITHVPFKAAAAAMQAATSPVIWSGCSGTAGKSRRRGTMPVSALMTRGLE